MTDALIAQIPDALIAQINAANDAIFNPPTLDERADEAARLVAFTLYPDLYADQYKSGTPIIYKKIARIIIQAIEEGIV